MTSGLGDGGYLPTEELFGGSAPHRIGGDDNIVPSTYDFVVSLVRLDLPDDTAVEGIRGAAGGDQSVLAVVASAFEDREELANDPLLAHIAELAIAAAHGVPVAPLTEPAERIVTEERRLLNMPLAGAFDELCERDRRLHQVLQTVTSPRWADSHRRRDTPTGRVRARLLDMIAGGRTIRGMRPSEAMSSRPAVGAIVRALRPLMGPDADPVLQTTVARQICTRYLAYASGALSPPD